MNLRKNLKSIKMGLVLAGLVLVVGAGINVNAADELITNGGFENEFTGWNKSGPVIGYSGHHHYGTKYAVLGAANNCVDNLSQTVTIPALVNSASLSYWYNVTSEEPNTSSAQFDKLTVTIRDSGNNILDTVDSISNLDKDGCAVSSCYHKITFDMKKYSGQTVKIYFYSKTDGSKLTYFRIDDVSVKVDVASPAPSAPQFENNALSNETPICDHNIYDAPAIRLNWNPATGATSYHVYRNGSLYENVATDTTFYNSANVTAGQTYTYYIQARNSSGSTNSNTITVNVSDNICGGSSPAKPGNFTLSNETPICDTSYPEGPAIRLNWTGSSGATSYHVYRNGNYYIGTATDATFYNSANVTAMQTYTYYIQARNASGNTNSNSVTVYVSDGVCSGSSNEPKCSDSDGGLDIYVKGRVIDTGFDSEDRCLSDNSLLEYTCKNDSWYANYPSCPDGCENGACIKIDEPQCSDFDFDEITTVWEARSLIYEKCSNDNLRIVSAVVQEVNSDYINIKTYRAGEGTTSIVEEKRINITSDTPVFEIMMSFGDFGWLDHTATKKTIASLKKGDHTIIECEEDKSMKDAEEFTAIMITKDVFLEEEFDLQAVYHPATQNVALQWYRDDLLSEIDGFKIYREISDGAIQEIGTTNNNYYSDNDVPVNTWITYYIKAYLGEDESHYSEPAMVHTMETAGEFNVFLDEIYCDANKPAVKISWESSVNASSYHICRRSNSSNSPFGFYESVDSTTLNFIDKTNLVAGDTYYYLVRAINEFGETMSNNSIEAKILEGICDGEQNTPPFLSVMEQFYENIDGETYIMNEGEEIHSTDVILIVFAEDIDADPYKIEFELRSVQEAFTGNGDAVHISNFISYSGNVNMPVTVEEGEYHWRARAIDSRGATTDWVEFGIVGNVDFTVRIEENLLETVDARDVPYFFQELQSDNTRILPEQTNPENVIDDDKFNFVSLGRGGEIVLRLERGVYPSTLMIGEIEKRIGTIESAQIFVSEDGSNWMEAGNVQNGNENTNDNSELILQMPQLDMCVHYIKIKDTTAGSDIDGFDLSGVKVNYQQGHICGNVFGSRLPITYSIITDENIDEGDRVFVESQGDYTDSYRWDWNGDGIIDEITRNGFVWHAWSFDCSNDGEVKYALTKVENGLKSTYATKINVDRSFFNIWHSCKNKNNEWVDEDLLESSSELLLTVDKMMRDKDGDGNPDAETEKLDWIILDSEVYGFLTKEDYLSLLLRPIYLPEEEDTIELSYIEFLIVAMKEEAYVHNVISSAYYPDYLEMAHSIFQDIKPNVVVESAGYAVPGLSLLTALSTFGSIPSLEDDFYKENGMDKALKNYLKYRNNEGADHNKAWVEFEVQNFIQKSIKNLNEDDQNLIRLTLEKLFEDLWNNYGDGLQLNLGRIDPEFRIEIREQLKEEITTGISYHLSTLADRTILKAHSPIDVIITDAYGNKTGYQKGVSYSDIPNSIVSVEKEYIEILGTDDETVINILGTGEGVYNMEIWQLHEGIPMIYKLTDIPTKPQAMHALTIDWSDVATDGISATMAIDQDDDGVFEKTITAGSEFNGADLITSARNLKEQTVENLDSVKTGKYAVDGKIRNINKEITKALRDVYWQDGNHLDSERGRQVFHSELRAVRLLNSYLQKSERILRYRLPSEVSDAFYQAIDDLTEADDILAQTALDETKNMTVSNQKYQRKYDQAIILAEKRIEKAREWTRQYKQYGTPKRIEYAINYYKQVWDYAGEAMKWAEKK